MFGILGRGNASVAGTGTLMDMKIKTRLLSRIVGVLTVTEDVTDLLGDNRGCFPRGIGAIDLCFG